MEIAQAGGTVILGVRTILLLARVSRVDARRHLISYSISVTVLP